MYSGIYIYIYFLKMDTIDRLYNCFCLSHFCIHLFRKKKRKTLRGNKYSEGDNNTNAGREAVDSHQGGVTTQETICEQSNDGKYQCRLTRLTTVRQSLRPLQDVQLCA